jgi:hypothetical protein
LNFAIGFAPGRLFHRSTSRDAGHATVASVNPVSLVNLTPSLAISMSPE